MRKQHKNYPSRIRSSGQTTLQSFLFKPRIVDEEEKPPPPSEQPVSSLEPQKREIIRTTNKTIKEKASAFSSIRSSGKESRREEGEAANGRPLNEAVFKRFTSSVREEGGIEIGRDGNTFDFPPAIPEISRACQDSRKRKNPFGGSSVNDHKNIAKHVVVLGDDPKPRPKRRQVKVMGSVYHKPLYNHYASGSGWWDGDMEGVDGEEVGWNSEVWEGMGSITLGGLEWH